MLTLRKQVKILDFGLAKVIPPESQAVTGEVSTVATTEAGRVMGTLKYMSPEQVLGREVDHRTDIFSLGVVLYEIATGRLPFPGASASETMDRILHAQPEAIARFHYNVPAELERIVRKCLEKDRERRYQSARELSIDLKKLHEIDSGLPTIAKRAARRDRLRPLTFASIAIAILTLVGLASYRLGWRDEAMDSLAVLPFLNESGDPDMDIFVMGSPRA